ncbi:MAG: hypothetical protein HRU31_18165 [Rhodobacteraceae bacterium]|nr:hypothetical protein [Paracoccaceae bacterium]
MSKLDDTAILLLTCNDYEAMEIVVDRVLRTTPPQVPIYILSNCHGLSGAEVCEDMARMSSLAKFDRVRWIHPRKRKPAYYGILDAIENDIPETYIVKFDDDAFPVNDGWLEALAETYARQDPDRIAYVTGMVNNNPYGFSRLVQLPELAERYGQMMAGQHAAGANIPLYDDLRIYASGEVHPGSHGTVWQFPQLARWIHEETTLQPKRYTDLISGLGEAEFDPSLRYSINVMYFHRDLWADCGNGGTDDEEMLHVYCNQTEKQIVVREDIPFVHLYFGPQKRYLRDLLPRVREVYGPLDAAAGHPLVDDWDQFKVNYTMEQLSQQLK